MCSIPLTCVPAAPHLMQSNGTWYLFYADWPNIRVATSSTVNGTYTVYPRCYPRTICAMGDLAG